MKRISLGVTLLLMAMVFVLPAGVAQAAQPDEVTGDFLIASAVPTSIEEVDDNCIIELQTTFNLDGDLVGAFDAEFRLIHFGPCGLPARELFKAQGTFVGSVGGEEGSFEFNFRGSIDANGNAQGQLVILNGEAGLANLHGTLDLTGQAGVDGTYSGAVHFDPANE